MASGNTIPLFHGARKNFPHHIRFGLRNFFELSRSVFGISQQAISHHRTGRFVTPLTKLVCSCSSRTVGYLA